MGPMNGPCGPTSAPAQHCDRGACDHSRSRGPSPPPGECRGPWGGHGPWGGMPPAWGMPPCQWGHGYHGGRPGPDFGGPGYQGPWGRRHGFFGPPPPPLAVASSMPVLTYFDLPGMAEPIRLVLTAGHIPFEDRRISQDEWTARYKNYSPLKQVPILEVDGQTIVQSHAILQYAATRAGFWPADEHQQLAAANISLMIDENRQKMKAAATSHAQQTPEEKRQSASEYLPPLFTKLEKTITEMGHRFAVGPHLTYIDFVIANIVEEGRKLGVSTEGYPKMNEIHKAVFDLPSIRRYRMERRVPAKPVIYDSSAEGLSLVAKWCLSVGEVDYEEVIMTAEELAQRKEENPQFEVPFIEVDGKEYRGPMGMIAYAAGRAGLVPDDVLEVAGAWAITRSLESSFQIIYDALVRGDTEKLKVLMTNEFIPYIKNIDPLVGENQDAEGHVVSNSLTFADLFVAMVYLSVRSYLGGYVDGLELPAMRRTYNLVMNIEAIKAYEYTKSRIDVVITHPEQCTKADSLRKLLELGNVKYVERAVTNEEWRDVYAANSPTGDSPYMEVDGHLIGGIKGCLTYAAERVGLLPPIYLGRAQAEMIYASWSKVVNEAAAALQDVVVETDTAEYATKVKEVRENRMPAVLSMFEKVITGHQHPAGYLVNNQLTYIDVYIGAEFNSLLSKRLVPDNYKDTYPGITKTWKLLQSKVANN